MCPITTAIAAEHIIGGAIGAPSESNESENPQLSSSEGVFESEPRRYILYNYGAQAGSNISKDSFPFVPTSTEYTRTGTFLRNLYTKTTQADTPWILNNEAVVDYRELMLKRIGNVNLQKAKSEHIDNSASPWWRFIEIWRILNIYRTLTQTHSKDLSPVSKFLDNQGTDSLSNALYPSNLRTLLRQNETKVSGKDWVGRQPLGSNVKPAAGVQVAYAQSDAKNDFNYYQEHPIGPMSMEAAFILAAQVAGVDWKKVNDRWTAAKNKNLRDSYWFGGYLQGASGDIWEVFEDGYSRQVGRVGDKGFNPTGNPDGGFYFAVELDPDITDAKKKNVFIFAVHTVDPHSRVTFVKNTNQMSLLYKSYDPTTTPKPVQVTSNDNTIFFSHGHSAVMKWTDWSDFLEGKYKPPPGTVNPIPPYTQVGQTHFYVLTENEKQDWPRYTDFRRGAGSLSQNTVRALAESVVDGASSEIVSEEKVDVTESNAGNEGN